MKIEKQVVSLDLAKQLKELGVKQESLFTWWHHGDQQHELIPSDQEPRKCRCMKTPYSAFTVAELGEMLPVETEFTKFPTIWSCEYQGESVATNKSEADARSRMLIYLIENKKIDVV